ncbi:hypothetical protein AB833_31310 [Chromatiales bacterium (ex Bugula neritina AB1)]|nr:hypothetical protein AB833_31310 [Chromatiales bacterium (ex Bugula neritina AB1)]
MEYRGESKRGWNPDNGGWGACSDEKEDEARVLGELTFLDNELVSLSTEVAEGGYLYARVSALINTLSTIICEAERHGVEAKAIKNTIAKSRKVFSSSPYVNRMQTWPRGYQGDFETVEMIHTGVGNTELNTIGQCVEYYAQTLPISQQHRNTLGHQQSLAMDCLRNDWNILSIGCGGAIDICTALKFFPDFKGSLTFIDMDEGAIDLVKKRTTGLDCTYRTKNIVRGIGSERNDFYDLVLCGGLFDYLEERVAKLLLRQIKGKLTSNGKLFFTNIARGNPFRIQMEYLGDWVLIERSEEELLKMIEGSIGENHEITIERDFTGLAILTTVKLISD